MSLANLAVLQELAQMRGDFDLSGVWTGRVNSRVKGNRRIAQRLERHRPGNVSDARELLGAVERQRAHRSHALGPVQKRESFFGFELNWPDLSQPQRLGARHSCAAIKRFAFAGDPERQTAQAR